MTHWCEDCGQEFETLSRLRLHDCAGDKSPEKGGEAMVDFTDMEMDESRSDEVTIPELDDIVSTARDEESSALHQAIAIYETRLVSAYESGDTDGYQRITRAYRERLITVLDETTQTEGWGSSQNSLIPTTLRRPMNSPTLRPFFKMSRVAP